MKKRLTFTPKPDVLAGIKLLEEQGTPFSDQANGAFRHYFMLLEIDDSKNLMRFFETTITFSTAALRVSEKRLLEGRKPVSRVQLSEQMRGKRSASKELLRFFLTVGFGLSDCEAASVLAKRG